MRLQARKSLAAVAIVSLLVSAGPVAAIIRVDVSLDRIYASAQAVIIARVDSVDGARKMASLRDAVTLEELGKKLLMPRDRTVTLDISGQAALAGRLKGGDPVVIFVGRRGGAIHAGDAWFKATPRDDKADWRIVEPYEIARTFPGTTPSLIGALLKVRAGKAPLVNGVMHHTWHGHFKLQTLDIKAKAIAAAEATGDAKADLVIATDKGMRFYKGTGPGKAFVEATDDWGLAGATARQIAFADANGDGKPDLLLDALYLNDGARFRQSKAGISLVGQDVLTVSLTDATGDGRPDAMVLTRNGTMTVYVNPGKDAAWAQTLRKSIWNGGDAPLAAHIGDWGDDGKPHVMVIRKAGLTRYSLAGQTADLQRLTGENPMYREKPRYFPMNDFLASVAWDRNGGDGNLDLHVATRKGVPTDLELVGRGHGAFFCNTEAKTAVVVKKHPQDRGRRYQLRAVAMAPADMYGDGSFEMLVIEEDGALWQMDSPIHVKGRPIGQ